MLQKTVAGQRPGQSAGQWANLRFRKTETLRPVLPSSQTCYDTRNIEDTARIYAQELPVPVFIGGQLRVIIPGPGNSG